MPGTHLNLDYCMTIFTFNTYILHFINSHSNHVSFCKKKKKCLTPLFSFLRKSMPVKFCFLPTLISLNQSLYKSMLLAYGSSFFLANDKVCTKHVKYSMQWNIIITKSPDLSILTVKVLLPSNLNGLFKPHKNSFLKNFNRTFSLLLLYTYS